MSYDAHKRVERRHRRVIRKGCERPWEGDNLLLDRDSVIDTEYCTRKSKDSDDDQRILDELPPHWNTFNKSLYNKDL